MREGVEEEEEERERELGRFLDIWVWREGMEGRPGRDQI